MQLVIDVGSKRESKEEFTVIFRYHESSSTATVDASNTLNSDALFGNREGDSLEETRILPKGQPRNLSLFTSITHDFIPEDQECYTISLITRPSALCINDGEGANSFFCHHTICN